MPSFTEAVRSIFGRCNRSSADRFNESFLDQAEREYRLLQEREERELRQRQRGEVPHPVDREGNVLTARRVDGGYALTGVSLGGILERDDIEHLDEVQFDTRFGLAVHRPSWSTFAHDYLNNHDEGGELEESLLGSAENPYSQEQILNLVGELSENENLDTDIQLRLREAFTKPGDVSYRLRVIPDDNLCKVFINEVWIIDLRGLERDPHEIGTKFLEIITRRMFGTDLAHLGDEDI